MKRVLWKAAGVVAIFGVAFCLAGVIRGGRPVSMFVRWQDGLPHVSYIEDGNGWQIFGAGGEQAGQATEIITVPAAPAAPNAPDAPVPPDAPAGASVPQQDAGYGHHAENGYGHRGESHHGVSYDADAIHSLDMEVGGAKVVLQPGSGWDIQVEGLQNYTSDVDDGVWEISCADIPVSNFSDSVITVTFPRDAVLQELELEIGLGSVECTGLRCHEADISVGAGSAQLSDFVVYGHCELEADLGGITLQGDLQCGAEIECGMGGIKCTLVRPQDYGYHVECGMGGVTIDGHGHGGFAANSTVNAGAAVQYHVECGMGGVEICFE